MKTLDELLKAKKEIEKQIRILKNTAVYTESGNSMLYRRKIHWNESDKDDTTPWSIGIKSIEIDTGTTSHRKPLITGYDKKEVINKLPIVISELQELYNKIKGADNEQIH